MNLFFQNKKYMFAMFRNNSLKQSAKRIFKQ